MIRPKVLLLCSENSCRTQMAEAFLRDLGGDRFEPISAGAEAALDPDAVAAMLEVGIDISGQQPKRVDPFMRERVLKWPIENPAVANNRDEHRVLVRRARDEIRERVVQFVQEHS